MRVYVFFVDIRQEQDAPAGRALIQGYFFVSKARALILVPFIMV